MQTILLKRLTRNSAEKCAKIAKKNLSETMQPNKNIIKKIIIECVVINICYSLKSKHDI